MPAAKYISYNIYDRCFTEQNLANSLDPGQMPQTEASDLGTQCLPFSLLWANSADNKLDSIIFLYI